MKVGYRIDGPEATSTLVLASSLGTTWELWDAQLPSLARDFRVVRYDHPGHGRSPTPESPVTVESLADDVVDLLDALGLERVSFCGLSLGGMVGMALALRAPERLDRLVLCCTAAHLGPVEGWYRARASRARRRDVRDRRGGDRTLVHRAVPRREPGDGRALSRDARGNPGRGLRGVLRGDRRWDARSDW